MVKTYNQPILKRDAMHNSISESYLADMTFRGEYSGNNLIYAFFARQGADESENVWQGIKLAYSGTNLISKKYPQVNGIATSEFVVNWTDRATYTYS